MIPERFVTEYPSRCGELLAMFERKARDKELVGSFALLVAAAAFTIPFGRMTEGRHLLGKPEHTLSSAINKLKSISFLDAPFWKDGNPLFFRYARIVTDPEHAHAWRDANDKHPFHSDVTKDGNTVLRVIRRALAHGNIVYLDENGYETPGSKLRYIAFLSKHDDDKTHRVVIFGEEDFLTFIKSWIKWLQTFPSEHELVFPEPKS